MLSLRRFAPGGTLAENALGGGIRYRPFAVYDSMTSLRLVLTHYLHPLEP